MSERGEAERRKALRRKKLWRWEPSWYIMLFALLVVTSVLQAVNSSLAFFVFLSLTIAVAVAILVAMVVDAVRGRRNPDASGNLTSLDSLTLVRGDATDAPSVTVADTKRHQNAIDAAEAFAGGSLAAILVPGATRWMGIRLRVGVQLVAGERVFLAGYLPADVDAELSAVLLPLRTRDIYVQVPAAVRGDRRPLVVDVDLGSVDAIVHKANAQPSPS